MRRRRRRARLPVMAGALSLAMGVAVSFCLFAVVANPVGRWPMLDRHLPIEALVLWALLALAPLVGRRTPGWLRLVLTLLLVPLALVHLADIEGPVLLGRDLDLAADLGHVPSLVGLFTATASLWQIIAAGLIALLVPLTLVAIVWAGLSAVEWGLSALPPVIRLVPLVLCALALGFSGAAPVRFVTSHETIAALGRQGATLVEAWQIDEGDRTDFLARLGPAPMAARDLSALGARDIYLIFFESYGAILHDDATLLELALPSLQRFEASLSGSGLAIRSARIASPTYGGGSWLAHGTVDAGTWLNNQRLYALETTTDRPTWPGIMAKAGWQTFDIQPGLKTPLDHADFWGFERVIGADDLAYHGADFGWFGIPDQYSLDQTRRLARDPGRPLFAQIVLVSSHIPFDPVPPLVSDPHDPAAFTPHPGDRDAPHPPNWNDLAGPYVRSVGYDLAALAQWLPGALGENGIAILLGDHQPPALIGHRSASHDVPIHIISPDAALVRRLAGDGWADGVMPTQSIGSMADLMERFLDAASRVEAPAPEPPVE